MSDVVGARERAPGRSRQLLHKIVRKKPRKRFRGLPPPPSFDFDLLADGTHLTAYETAAVIRRSLACLENWRLNPKHPLQWQYVGDRVTYTARAIRKFRKE